jgi:hypothetical protein
MESIQIYLNSQSADKSFNGAADCEYNLPLIEIPDGFHIYLSVVSCLIPYSFYNINNRNNVLQYSFDGITINTLSIPIGNYNVNSLLSVLKSNLVAFTITYDNIKNKFTFTHPTNNFMFMSSSTCLQILGFNNNETISSVIFSLTSVNCVNVYTIRTVQVNSNLITYNINKVQKNNFCILCSVPITCTPFSLIEYINRTNFKTNLFLNRISNIKIKLTDDNGNLIDLNGCHYSLTLQLDVVSFT